MRLLTFEPKVSGTWNPQKTQLQVKIFRYKDAVTSFFRSGQEILSPRSLLSGMGDLNRIKYEVLNITI
ncbi:unnamed protein product [Tenebrio molitor]|nr:unnamed protein product [Tenebrio molitor]